MKKGKDNEEIKKDGRQGTGSAEQTGRDRSEQKSRTTDGNKQERKNIAGEAGVGRKRIATIKDLGGLSGRDDAAGGSGDDMESQHTNQPTDR